MSDDVACPICNDTGYREAKVDDPSCPLGWRWGSDHCDCAAGRRQRKSDREAEAPPKRSVEK